MASSKSRSEWDSLKEWERNSILWPDFQEWSENIKVKIEKENESSNYGIVTVVLQTEETPVSYHIVKEVKEEKPASEKLKKCDWIVAVNEQSTIEMKESDQLSKAIKTDGKNVTLTIRRPASHLECKKKWEDKVELKLPSSCVDKFSFCHFYSKSHKYNEIEDRILVFKLNETKKKSMGSPQLRRGDELLSVNKTSVAGRKLKEIYDLVTATSKVVLSVKKILAENEYVVHLCKHFLRLPHKIFWGQPRSKTVVLENVGGQDSSLGFILSSSKKKKSSDEVFHIVTEVRQDTPASLAGICAGDRVLSVNNNDLTKLEKVEAAELLRNQNSVLNFVIASPEGVRPDKSERKSSKMSRNDPELGGRSASKNRETTVPKGVRAELVSGDRSLSGGQAFSGNDKTPDTAPLNPSENFKKSRRKKDRFKTIQSNEAYLDSDTEPAPSKEAQSNKNNKLCEKCIKDNVKQSRCSDEREFWPATKICPTNFKEICDTLDQDIPGMDVEVFAERLGFPAPTIKTTCQTFKNNGGIGAAKAFIEIWTSQSTDNKVGKLRQIFAHEDFQRGDVCDAIDKWLKRDDICLGCGAVIYT